MIKQMKQAITITSNQGPLATTQMDSERITNSPFRGMDAFSSRRESETKRSKSILVAVQAVINQKARDRNRSRLVSNPSVVRPLSHTSQRRTMSRQNEQRRNRALSPGIYNEKPAPQFTRNQSPQQHQMSQTSLGSQGFTHPAKLKLIQRLALKFGSKFGTKQEDIKVIQETIKKHLENKDQISPEVFDSIEVELNNKFRNALPVHKMYPNIEIRSHREDPQNSQIPSIKFNRPTMQIIQSQTPQNKNGQKLLYGLDLKKEFHKQMVDIQLTDFMTKQKPDPIYNFKHFAAIHGPTSNPFDPRFASLEGRTIDGRSKSVAKKEKHEQVTDIVKQIKDTIQKKIHQSSSRAGDSIPQNTLFHSILRKTNFPGSTKSDTTSFQDAQITNESLWQMIQHYKLEKLKEKEEQQELKKIQNQLLHNKEVEIQYQQLQQRKLENQQKKEEDERRAQEHAEKVARDIAIRQLNKEYERRVTFNAQKSAHLFNCCS